MGTYSREYGKVYKSYIVPPLTSDGWMELIIELMGLTPVAIEDEMAARLGGGAGGPSVPV